MIFFDIPYSHALTLLRVQGNRLQRQHNATKRQEAGGLQGFHNRMRARRGVH